VAVSTRPSLGQDFKECRFSAWHTIGEAFESFDSPVGPIQIPKERVLPITVPDLDHLLGMLVAGVGARCELDEPYRTVYLIPGDVRLIPRRRFRRGRIC
jgi:hypothetical protein